VGRGVSGRGSGERIFLDFKNAEGPVVGRGAQPASNLPNLPTSTTSGKKPHTAQNTGSWGKQPAPSKPKPVKEGVKEGKPRKKSSGSAAPSQQAPEEDAFRRHLEEKSKKYSHLPVVDKEEERRKAERRQAKISNIFSSCDKQLGEFSDLTTAHMASHGITLTPGDTEPETETDQGSPLNAPAPDLLPTAPPLDIHTIRYRDGVLSPRGQNQTSDTLYSPPAEPDKVPKMCHETSSRPRTSVTFADGQPEAVSEPQLPVVNPYTSERGDALGPNEPPGEAQGEDYLRLGHTLTALTERMGSMTREIRDDEIPFIDNGEGAEDYTRITRTRDNGDTDSTSPTSDSDYDTDSDLARVLAPNLNPNLRVAKIQLEVVPSISSTLVVSERLCQGSEVISTTRKTVRRELSQV